MLVDGMDMSKMSLQSPLVQQYIMETTGITHHHLHARHINDNWMICFYAHGELDWACRSYDVGLYHPINAFETCVTVPTYCCTP